MSKRVTEVCSCGASIRANWRQVQEWRGAHRHELGSHPALHISETGTSAIIGFIPEGEL